MPKKAPAQGIGIVEAVTSIVKAAADKDTQAQMRAGETYHQAKQRIAQNIPEPPSTAPSWPAPSNPILDAYTEMLKGHERANWERLGRRISTTMSTPAPANPMAEAYDEAQRRMEGKAVGETATEMSETMAKPYTPPERLSPPASSRTMSRQWSRTPGWR